MQILNLCAVQHEFRSHFGHPSSRAFVRFECAPADDLSFEISTVGLLGPPQYPTEIARRLNWESQSLLRTYSSKALPNIQVARLCLLRCGGMTSAAASQR